MAIKNEAIQKIRSQYNYLSSEFDVERIGLFGSVASETDNEKSDIDLLVELRRPMGLKFIRLAEYLERILGRKVDLITSEGLKNIRVREVAEDIRRTLIYV
ncbi:MAG TPA: nucleotidyltransferase domain-containing protein [Syntrophorhabdaceae bacterium]|nr:nucleotidyltransferase domain-containing protein [Syntrophorhabdaceae bacterium]